ncbi:MAG: MBL fold metallo-hydrolase [Actinobacteria bacterium]|jgi:ribonuclease BN (tRNA processing enzyme)|nr:MBL fold metallo-hydrolase [Actinomycetota bacterium]
MLTVTVLGCDGSHQAMGGACSSYVVKDWATGGTLLVDAGSGSFANYQRFFSLEDVDAVVLSHSHPDHWADLESLAVAMRYTSGRSRPLRIIAPSGVSRLVQHAVGPLFEWDEVSSGDRSVAGSMQLSFFATDHVKTTLALRVEVDDAEVGKISLGYTADTGSKWSPAELGYGLDMLVSEATFTSLHEGRSQHLSGRQAGRFARDAGARRLMVTHYWPIESREAIAQEAEDAFGGTVVQARVGLGIAIMPEASGRF